MRVLPAFFGLRAFDGFALTASSRAACLDWATRPNDDDSGVAGVKSPVKLDKNVTQPTKLFVPEAAIIWRNRGLRDSIELAVGSRAL